VQLVINITDVDDKLIAEANNRNLPIIRKLPDKIQKICGTMMP